MPRPTGGREGRAAWPNYGVIGPDVKFVLFLRRLRQRNNISVKRSGCVLGHRIRPPDFSHHRQLVAIGLAGEISADRLPGVAAIIAPEKLVGRKIQTHM